MVRCIIIFLFNRGAYILQTMPSKIVFILNKLSYIYNGNPFMAKSASMIFIVKQVPGNIMTILSPQQDFLDQ